MSHPFNIIELDTVDSTNNYVTKKLKENAIGYFDVIMAHNQTNGRGQRNRQWQSSAGENLTCSFVLDFGFLKLPEMFDLNRLISLAIINMLLDLNADCEAKIKWPNDIKVYARKLSGILIDIQVVGSKKTLICGVGINVNQTNFGEVEDAISLKQIFGQKFEPKFILELFLTHLDKLINQVHRSGVEALRSDYEKHLFALNETWQFERENTLFRSKVLGVNEKGELMLSAFKNQNINLYSPMDLRWIKPVL